jgi:hypothetical protein
VVPVVISGLGTSSRQPGRFSVLIQTACSSVGPPRVAGDPRGVVDGQSQLASNWAPIGNGWGGMMVKVEL